MALPFERNFPRCKSGKRVYYSEAFARVFGQMTIVREGLTVPLFPYVCHLCRYWHVSKQDRHGRAAITAAKAFDFRSVKP